MFRWLTKSKFAQDISGATLVYVTLIMAVLIGATGLVVDFSRLYIAHTQAQSAADAAAIAAANQLDGSTSAWDRAENAALGAAALVVNGQDFANEPNATMGVQVTLRYLTHLPDDDDEPITSSYEAGSAETSEFVEATTEILTHNNLFLPALGVAQNRQVVATAVAGQESAICRVTPLAICNPAEIDGITEFDLNDWRGTQILVRASPSGQTQNWAPGNFGFLQPPDGNGAKDLGEMLASVDGGDVCFSTSLNTRPGNVASTRNALNTRFDMYDTPGFNKAADKLNYPPAANVTKGFVYGGGGCNPKNVNVPAGVMALPRDNGDFPFVTEPGVDDIANGARFGDGNWDCATYWENNHPEDFANGITGPSGFTCNDNSSAMSRFDMYQWEIENNQIPSPGTNAYNTGNDENGRPICTHADNRPAVDEAPVFNINTDRRMVQFAVMNCIAEDVKGNSKNVPPVAFVRAFLTEPVTDPVGNGAGNDYDVYLEVVDFVEAGTNNGPLKEYVEIFR